ncbi:MAG: LppP/LprE family lipoprotein [Solirubrobacteraceae bacterium]
MTEPSPSRREPADRKPARILAVAALAGLLVVLMVVIAMIGGAAGGDADEETAATATAEPTATETATETPKPDPTPVPLTAEQRLERQEAIDLVASKSFEVVDKADWNPDDTLQVLIGETDDGNELAFWFVDGTYLGNDSTDLSTKLRVKRTDDIEVTLRYAIYEDGDKPGKPTGEPIDVNFRYEAGTVEPVEALPAPEQRLL